MNEVLAVINSIKEYQPKKIYLYCDGPKEKSNDKKLIEAIRVNVIYNIDWDCEIQIKFNERNKGCRIAMHEAIQWFFSNEKYGIVLEDDVVPNLSFYRYCELALKYFENDMRVGTITGRNNLTSTFGSDVYLSSLFSSWGWASWSNRILDIDVDIGYSNENFTIPASVRSSVEKSYIKSIISLMQAGYIDSWACPYYLNFVKLNLLHVTPRLNMIKNIGYGPGGTHSNTFNKDDLISSMYFEPKDLSLTINENYIKDCLIKDYGGIVFVYLFRFSKFILPLIKIHRFLRRKLFGVIKIIKLF